MSTVLCEVGKNALPVCLFTENPNRLVRLLDMIPFHAEDFCRVSGQIGQVYMDIRHGTLPQGHSWSAVSTNLTIIEGQCVSLGLNATLAQIRRVRDSVSRVGTSLSMESFGRELIEIYSRFLDELEAKKLFALESDHAKYFEEIQFSPKAIEVFPDAAFDMEEAGKCFALDRPTACVFHLMRVTEHGLHGIAKALEIKDERPNWEPIIKKIDSELKADYKDRKYKGSAEFLANMSTHTHAVKVAWRNRVMHVEKKHTPEEAKEIFNATSGLMRYLAEELPKKRPGIVQSIRDIMKR